MVNLFPKVYSMDDDVRCARLSEVLIRSAGLSVKTFASAREDPWPVCRKELPSCLVLDIRLPDISGFELQQELATKTFRYRLFPSPVMSDISDVGASIKKKRGAWSF